MWQIDMKFQYASVQDELAALHDRMVRVRVPENDSALMYLQQGRLTWRDDEEELEGPGICYWPHHERPSLNLRAGGRLRILGLSDTSLLDAIGAKAESVHLRMLVEQSFFTSLSEETDLEQIETLFDWFTVECLDIDRQSPMTLAAYLRLMFINALRIYQPEPTSSSDDQTSILRQFRHLVELHYRDHWQVASYAQELAIDRDRLHRICKRETGRSPAELVYERLTAEAKARLEKSGYPLKKIAADLGFADATRFSHFFKRRTDMSPGVYRAVVSSSDANELVELKRGFADWP